MTKDDPDDISDDIEKLSERKNYLALWLSRHRLWMMLLIRSK